MSQRHAGGKVGGTMITAPPPEAEIAERLKAHQPNPPQEQGECPYCHHELLRRTVQVSENPDFVGKQYYRTLLTYWACTNEHCCLMFHQRPQVNRPSRRH